MRLEEQQELSLMPEIAELRKDYKKRGIPFDQAFEWAVDKATQGIQNPKAKNIVQYVANLLWDNLMDELEQKLPPPKTIAGKILRWLIRVL